MTVRDQKALLDPSTGFLLEAEGVTESFDGVRPHRLSTPAVGTKSQSVAARLCFGPLRIINQANIDTLNFWRDILAAVAARDRISISRHATKSSR